MTKKSELRLIQRTNYVRRYPFDEELITDFAVNPTESKKIIFTANRPTMIKGYQIYHRLVKTGDLAQWQRCLSTLYVSRDSANGTEFDLHVLRAEFNAMNPVAGTNPPFYIQPMEQARVYFTDDEAEELGLLLGYGSSFYLNWNVEVKVSGTCSFVLRGVIFYKEML